MISSTDQIQILYEISLIIGEGSNLKQAASKALSVYLRKLNCSAGAILFQRNINERYWFQLLYSIPSQISRNQIYQEITRQIGKSHFIATIVFLKLSSLQSPDTGGLPTAI